MTIDPCNIQIKAQRIVTASFKSGTGVVVVDALPRITDRNEIVREIGRTHPRDITQLVRVKNETTGEQTVYFADEFAAFPVHEANGGAQ